MSLSLSNAAKTINSQEIINSAPAFSDSKNASPIATALGSLRGRRRPDARRMAGQVPARDQPGILRLHDWDWGQLVH